MDGMKNTSKIKTNLENRSETASKKLGNLSKVKIFHHIIYDASALQSTQEICLRQRPTCRTLIIPHSLSQHLLDLPMDIHLTNRRTKFLHLLKKCVCAFSTSSKNSPFHLNSDFGKCEYEGKPIRKCFISVDL